jgi:hypothetical protein
MLGACTTMGSGAGLGSATGTSATHHRAHSPVRIAPLATTTSTTSALGPLASPPLPSPGRGFRVGAVTAIGDSVMLDAQGSLEEDIPGIDVSAAVSRQWSEGEEILSSMKSEGELGAVVVVGLGTNGSISTADFDQMMTILAGASRVVFVTVHVDQPWQDQVNAVLTAGVAAYPNTVLADWAGLAAAHPEWFGSDGTHLPIGGAGAQALAALIASDV